LAITGTILLSERPGKAEGWVNLGPGGGGWYRCAAFSPQGDKLIVGGDVSGVFVSADYENFTINNRDLVNRVMQAVYFHPTREDVVYLSALRTRSGIGQSPACGSGEPAYRGSVIRTSSIHSPTTWMVTSWLTS
jgi:hypothetical protein